MVTSPTKKSNTSTPIFKAREPRPLLSRILYEDKHLLVLDKEVGEIVQEDKSGDASLLRSLSLALKERDAKPGNVYLQAVHRIDRPVSGVVLFAKVDRVLPRLHEQFSNGAVERFYYALVEGRPEEMEGRIENYLHRNAKINKTFVVRKGDPRGQLSSLAYEMVGATKSFTLLKVQLFTGRHHQIRAQLASIGCPVHGDLKYGAKRSLPNGGIALHAFSLRFQQPITGESLYVESPCAFLELVEK